MLTAETIGKHNSRQSCWVVVENHAYDLTEYLDSHPGGAEIILRYAGKDATEVYAPVHPAGTIEQKLPKENHLGSVDIPTSRAHKSPKQTTSVYVSLEPHFITNEMTKKPTLSRSSSKYPIPIDSCVNLSDIEEAAKRVLSEQAWAYYSTAAEDFISYDNNRHDWAKILFRPRMLKNVKDVNMQCNILGHVSSLPFFIAPSAFAQLGNPDGELCLVRGASRYNIPYCMSDGTSIPHAKLIKCFEQEQGGGVLFFQLYARKSKEQTIQRIRMARELGFKALVLTVDVPVVGNREGKDRYQIKKALTRNGTHVPILGSRPEGSRENDEDDIVLHGIHSSTLTWEDLEWIREEWGKAGPICIKGILTAEDAKIAYDMGINSIYLSNHGGRQIDSAPSSLRTLLEIRRFYPEVLDKCEVILDGGVRRSKDILKALCLGATSVGLGRPFMYALGAYGTEGVFKTIQILSDELETSMRLLGVTSFGEVRPHMVNCRDLDISIISDIPDFRNLRPTL